MGNIFSTDSIVTKVLTKIADLLLLNILFVLTCIPIFTIGAAITALDDIAMKMARNQESYIIKGYFVSFAKNFKKSTVIFLILVVIGLIIGVDIYFWMGLDTVFSKAMAVISCAIAAVYCAECLYVFALQAKFENSIFNTMKNAILMSVERFPFTLILAVFMGVIIYLNMNFFGMNLLMLLCGFSPCALLMAIVYLASFSRYIPKEKTLNEQQCDNE